MVPRQDPCWSSDPATKFELVLRAYAALGEQAPTSVRRKASAPRRRAAKRKRPGRPESHFCPISREVMRDPVIAPDGHSYERAQLEAWLVVKRTSPLTQQRVPPGAALPRNHALRQAIEDFD